MSGRETGQTPQAKLADGSWVPVRVLVNPDGSPLSSAGGDYTPTLWREIDGVPQIQLPGGQWVSREVAMNPDGTSIKLGMPNPMTAQDDLIIGGAQGAPSRLGKGADGQVLTVDQGTHHLAWKSPAGGAVSSGTFAARPAAGTAGALYLPTDSAFVSEDTGAAWQDFGPIRRMVEPVGMGWDNQNGAVLSAAGGIVSIKKTVLQANGTLCAYGKARPSAPPWSVTVDLTWLVDNAGATNSRAAGLYLYDSTGGRLVLMTFWSGNIMRIDHLSAFNVFVEAGAGGSEGWHWLPQPLRVKLGDDGVNAYFDLLVDGVNPMRWYSEGRVAYLTNGPLRWGMFLYDNTSGNAIVQASLLSAIEGV